MARRTAIRATRFVAASNQVDRGAEPAPRRLADYWCALDHQSSPMFSAEATPPVVWPCKVCGAPSAMERGTAPTAARAAGFSRTPYEFLMMRRTVEQGERLLAEALVALRETRRAGSRKR